ncbi:hypothetical protein RHEC894_CH01003 [Rhizobium sp. CIAT894]|uniref:hypothetical protein n=1 Tax=Rhizobium sp. CIAT894 TaxID=2020312 RepID=UPI000A2084E6|nr:hypothetical protein [Rhizobium sp. CIAT894]ARM87344.1 hypothetical protein RHEC894_CH01003 [Rhizobium sp. CIAT894]
MADASAFGRRMQGAASSVPASGSLSGKPDQTRDEGHAGLDRRSNLLSLIAQALAFVAFMLFFAAAYVRPPDPMDLRMLAGSIYVLDEFTNALGLSGVKSAVSSVSTGFRTFPDLALYVSMILVLATGFSIIKGRWLFAGLTAAFFLILWSLFGQSLYLPPFALTLFAFIALVFHAPLSRRAIIAIVAGSVLALPLIIGLVSDLARDFGAPPIYAKYRVIRSSELPSDVHETAAANGDRQNRSAIAPYFLAQVEALRGNGTAAAAALDQLDASGFLLNDFERSRFQTIRNFALASGGFGPAAREKFTADASAQSQKAFLLLAAGLLFAIAAPLTNGFGWLVARRSRRVFLIERELGDRRAKLADAVKRAAGVFGTNIAKRLVQSQSVANGERAIEAITSRARTYLLLVLGLMAFAALSALAAYWVWLPDAAENTAFHFVALAGDTADYAQRGGVSVMVGVDEFAVWPSLLSLLKYPALIAAIVLATRRSRYLGALTAMAIVAFFVLDDYRFSQHSRREALPQQFSALLRSKLDLAAGRSTIALEPAIGGFEGLSLNLRGSIPAENKSSSSAAEVGIDPSLAAYTLAQLAYLEGDAAEASRFLSQVRDVRELHAAVHCERLATISEWVSAHGHATGAIDWVNLDFPSRVRQLGRSLLTLSVASLALAVLVTPLLAIAVARRNRIEALIEERGRYQL